MDSMTHKFIVSLDVVFDEVSSLFSPNGEGDLLAIEPNVQISSVDSN